MIKKIGIILVLMMLLFTAYILLLNELLEVSYGFANFPFGRLTPEAAAQKALWNVLKWAVPIALFLHVVKWLVIRFLLGMSSVKNYLLPSAFMYVVTSAWLIYPAHQDFLKTEQAKSRTSYSHSFTHTNTST